MKNATSTLTDWRVRDEDLPDVQPGEEFERVITPQRHVVLCWIVVRDLRLARLQIGAVDVSFQIDRGRILNSYRPFAFTWIAEQLAKIGAKVIAPNEIKIVAGLDVRLLLRNDDNAAAKPLVTLLVQEEID